MSGNRAGKVAEIAHSHWDFRAGKVAETAHSHWDFRAGKVASARLARGVRRGSRMLRGATALGTASDARSRAVLDAVGAAHLTASHVPGGEAPTRVLRGVPWRSFIYWPSNYASSSPAHRTPVREVDLVQ